MKAGRLGEVWQEQLVPVHFRPAQHRVLCGLRVCVRLWAGRWGHRDGLETGIDAHETAKQRHIAQAVLLRREGGFLVCVSLRSPHTGSGICAKKWKLEEIIF